MSGRAARAGCATLPLPVHQLYPVRTALHADSCAPIRSVEYRGGLGFSDRSLSGGTAIFSANRRSSTDETTQTQPLTGLQGPSGFGRHQGREDAGAASGAL